MARYNIYYSKYSIFARDYVPYIKVVNVEDVYHEIGKMICQSLEKIESIRYTKPQASQEDCEKLWIESGYRKLTENTWIKETPPTAAQNKSRCVELPCCVGDKVYIIDDADCIDIDDPNTDDSSYVLEVTVTAVGFDVNGFWITMDLPLGLKQSAHVGQATFGKTVFLTEEDAEKALKERIAK